VNAPFELCADAQAGPYLLVIADADLSRTWYVCSREPRPLAATAPACMSEA